MRNGTILIVDDQEMNREILCRMFRDKYAILQAENGKAALELFEKNEQSIAVILLDIIMPVMDGFQVLENLNKRHLLFDVPVILITCDNSREVEKKSYDYGVADLVKKPFDPYVVKRRVENVIELYTYKNHLERMVKEQTATLSKQAQKLRDANNQLIDTMSTIVEFRNLESGEHVHQIRRFTNALSVCVAQRYPEYKLDTEKISLITSASAMHDVGKIVIPDNILLKPGKLTANEFEIMKTHTTKGCDIVNTVFGLEEERYYRIGYEICRYHHERFDGKGYPDGLRGNQIPISAQIVSIADVYDALISERVYKKAYSKEEAFHMIMAGECGIFSSEMLGCFKSVKGKFEELADISH